MRNFPMSVLLYLPGSYCFHLVSVWYESQLPGKTSSVNILLRFILSVILFYRCKQTENKQYFHQHNRESSLSQNPFCSRSYQTDITTCIVINVISATLCNNQNHLGTSQ